MYRLMYRELCRSGFSLLIRLYNLYSLAGGGGGGGAMIVFVFVGGVAARRTFVVYY